MQLESTLFGVCVIQIKPLLEKLLNLPEESLTKEIELSQNLLDIFLEYQIPSDLLSFNGPAGSSIQSKVNTVKGYVKNIQELITDAKKLQIEEKKEEERKAQLESIARSTPPPMSKMIYKSKEKVKRVKKMKKGKTMDKREKRMESAAPTKNKRMKVTANPAPAPPLEAPAPPEPSPEPSPEPAVAEAPDAGDSNDSVVERAQALDVVPSENIDYTKIPAILEAQYEKFDEDGALRPTIISAGKVWQKTSYKSILSGPTESTLPTEDLKREKNKAFDLLDALTKSGALSVDHAALHVVIAATHCFDKTLMNTVVQDNVNPIEKVERSALIIATTIHQTETAELIVPAQLQRVTDFNANLLEGPKEEENWALSDG